MYHLPEFCRNQLHYRMSSLTSLVFKVCFVDTSKDFTNTAFTPGNEAPLQHAREKTFAIVMVTHNDRWNASRFVCTSQQESVIGSCQLILTEFFG
jgi:hypothetical protein